MTKPITFEGQHGIEGIESVLREIEKSPTSPLLLPRLLQKRHFGVDAAVIQALITWARNGGTDLHLYAGRDNTASLANLVETDHGLVAFLLAKRLLEQRSATQIPIPKTAIDERVNQRVAPHNNIRRGPKLFFLCKDNKNTVENVTPLYYPTRDADDGVLDEDEFRELLTEQLRLTISTVINVAKNNPIITDVLAPLGTILFELFENTHKWARADVRIEPFPWSIRGIRIEVHRASLQALRGQTNTTPPVRQYLDDTFFTTFPTQVRLLEVSVLDSGPGLAARALNRQVNKEDSIDREYEAIQNRFTLHYTSSAATHRGKGLPEILRLLSARKGFLRVRTGRLHLKRDFIKFPYHQSSIRTKETQQTQEPLFHDWNNSPSPAAYSTTAGVLMTFLFPLAGAGVKER